MTKSALFIGCNYPGTDGELLGCHNDAKAMKSLLMEHYGFKEEETTLMLDTDESTTQPTAANIKETLKKMVKTAVAGDVLFVHFSGHGIQIPEEGQSDEADRLDEAIVPTDLNVILDDDLREIFQSLKDEVALTVVTDCCHSGGLLDHEAIHISGGGSHPDAYKLDLSSFWARLGLGKKSKGVDVSKLGEDKLRNRALPVEKYLVILGKKGVGVADKKIKQVIHAAFGAQTSNKIKRALAFSSRAIDTMQKEGCLTTICRFTLTKFGLLKPAGNTRSDIVLPKKPPKNEQLADDVGILITACQSNENSADTDLSGDKTNAGGAMTHALITVLKQHHEANGGKPLSNRDVVLKVRETLEKAGFVQNPCLEGSTKNADRAFLTWVAV